MEGSGTALWPASSSWSSGQKVKRRRDPGPSSCLDTLRASLDAKRDLLTGEYAYLTDLRKKRAGTDWKAVRQAKAASVLKTLDGIHHPNRTKT